MGKGKTISLKTSHRRPLEKPDKDVKHGTTVPLKGQKPDKTGKPSKFNKSSKS